jgi:hypothetical protein
VKVKELIERLSKLDPEAQVACHRESSSGDSEFFEIDGVDETPATAHRGDDGAVGLTFGRGPEATPWAVVSICSGEDD